MTQITLQVFLVREKTRFLNSRTLREGLSLRILRRLLPKKVNHCRLAKVEGRIEIK
jgi:hypothetical protein